MQTITDNAIFQLCTFLFPQSPPTHPHTLLLICVFIMPAMFSLICYFLLFFRVLDEPGEDAEKFGSIAPTVVKPNNNVEFNIDSALAKQVSKLNSNPDIRLSLLMLLLLLLMFLFSSCYFSSAVLDSASVMFIVVLLFCTLCYRSCCPCCSCSFFFFSRAPSVFYIFFSYYSYCP